MKKGFRLTAAVVVLFLAVRSGRGQEGSDQVASGSSRMPESRALVVTVDHFFAFARDPERLFLTFRDTLGLPVAWPFRSYGSFSSGALSVGNTVLELATWELSKGEESKTEWKMLAFEPAGDTGKATAELARRGISHSAPDVNAFRDAAGKETVGWTNTGLNGPGLSDVVFLCDYAARERVASMHQRGAEELLRAQGGPLGVRKLKIIEIGVTDLQGARREWLKLIDVAEQAEGDLFHFGAGPSVQLTSAPASGIRRIVLQVKSLERARAFLAERQMLAEATETLVSIAPEAIGGLNIALVGE